jgi:competence protein ComEC
MLRAKLSLVLYGLLTSLSLATAHAAGGSLKVDFLDLGQADGILVTCPDGDHHLLIDAGDTTYPGSSQRFRSFLTQTFPQPSRRLTVVVASHMHNDHIGSMAWVLENFKVDTYIDNGDTADTAVFGNLLKVRRRLSRNGSLTYVNARQNPSATIEFCPQVKMTIMEPWAQHKSLSGKNDRSVVVRLDYQNRSFLFVGDVEKSAEQVMLNEFTPDQRRWLDADVLKVGHHASDTSSTVPFVTAVSPKVTVVSCGKRGVGTNARYKHPRASTLDTYRDWFTNHPSSVRAQADSVWAYEAQRRRWIQAARPTGMWLTVQDGTIAVQTDGEKLDVETHNP